MTTAMIDQTPFTGHNKYLMLLTLLLLALWVPSTLDKLTDFSLFQSSMLRQQFPLWINKVLAFAIPLTELAVIALLLTTRTRLLGLYLSAALLLLFTGYIGLAIWLDWIKIPCGCSKLISKLTWQQHFWFNLFFLGISLLGWLMHRKQDRKDVGSENKIIPSRRL